MTFKYNSTIIIVCGRQSYTVIFISSKYLTRQSFTPKLTLALLQQMLQCLTFAFMQALSRFRKFVTDLRLLSQRVCSKSPGAPKSSRQSILLIFIYRKLLHNILHTLSHSLLGANMKCFIALLTEVTTLRS